MISSKEPEPDPLRALTRIIRRLIIATAFLYIALAGLSVFLYVKARQDVHQNNSARAGLCALRQDLSRRVDEQRSFLREHPAGIPGIPLAVISASLANAEQTLKALDVVHCR